MTTDSSEYIRRLKLIRVNARDLLTDEERLGMDLRRLAYGLAHARLREHAGIQNSNRREVVNNPVWKACSAEEKSRDALLNADSFELHGRPRELFFKALDVPLQPYARKR